MKKHDLLVAVVRAAFDFDENEPDDSAESGARTEKENSDAKSNLDAADALDEDYEKSLKSWLELTRSGAECGFPDAQYTLGNLCWSGTSVAQDREQAVDWYRQAAEKGYADAQAIWGAAYFLGEYVVLGEDGDKCPCTAVTWWRKAAAQCNASAQCALGVAYFLGEGVVQNYQEAYIWFLIAKAYGDEDAGGILRSLDADELLLRYEIRSAQKKATARFEEINNCLYDPE